MALGWSGVIQQEPTKFPLYAHAPTQHMLPAPARAELRAVGGAGEPDERQHLRLNQGSRCRQDRITSPVSRPSLANSQTPLFRPPCSSTLTLSLDRPATEGRARVREREREKERESSHGAIDPAPSASLLGTYTVPVVPCPRARLLWRSRAHCSAAAAASPHQRLPSSPGGSEQTIDRQRQKDNHLTSTREPRESKHIAAHDENQIGILIN